MQTRSSSPAPRFDSLAAWNSAAALVKTNRDVLLAVAGVFFLLPSLAFALFVPQPEAAPGLSQEAALKLMQDYYAGAWPWLLLVSLMQMAGTVTLLIVMTDRGRPTVGQALARGLAATPVYFLAQMLFGLGLGLVMGLFLAVAAATGLAALIALATAAIVVLAIHAFLRLLLVAPVLAVENERNPLVLLRRSWALTRGQSLRLAGFFGLALLLFLVVTGLAMMLITGVLALTVGGEIERVLGAAFSSGFTAVAMVYFTGMLAAVHRQLAGPADAATSDPVI